MRIGLFTASQWSPDENPADVLAALREQVRTARDCGFSSLIVGQHLLTGPMGMFQTCLLYTSPSPRDQRGSRMPSSA